MCSDMPAGKEKNEKKLRYPGNCPINILRQRSLQGRNPLLEIISLEEWRKDYEN